MLKEQREMAQREEIARVSRFLLITNSKIAEAEAIGMYFPNGSLYSTYCAFDILATIDDEDDSSIESITECADQAVAMLGAAYVFASLAIGQAYKEKSEDYYKRRANINLGDYYDYVEIKNLKQAEERFEKVASSFDEEFIYEEVDDLNQVYSTLLTFDEKTLLEYLHKIDSWSEACKELHQAQLSALSVYEEAQSAEHKLIKKANSGLNIGSALLLILSCLQFFYS